MFFKITPEIFQDFPHVKIGIIVAHNIDNTKDVASISELFKKQQDIVVSKLDKPKIGEHPYITAWREAYKKFGAKPKEHLSSIENLVTRIVKGQSLKPINTLVDLYNYVSLKYLLPAGGEDLGTISGDIILAKAGTNEIPVKLLGDPTERAPEVGEIFYKDNNGAICRRWNWKEADRTKITKDTSDAILLFEALPEVDFDVLKAATYELAGLIEKYCGGSASVAFLDSDSPEIVLKKLGKYVPLDTNKEIVQIPFDIYEKKTADTIIHHAEKQDSVEHEIRIAKVKKLREMGIEPWPAFKPVGSNCAQVIKDYNETGQEKEYSVSGRVMTIRAHGKSIFANLQDLSGKLQIYLKFEILGDQFKFFQDFIDIGDIIWCHGSSFKTKMGEITLNVERFTLLSKCLHPLPEKFHGIADIEIKYRQRYLDLITSQDTKARFIKRSTIIASIRQYLNSHNYLEVETPMLHPIAGGAAARPFITHHNALDTDFYMRIAPELYLKRLVVGGFERVFEINRNFRNEGISTRHNPEFTMLEFYTANEDYHYAMNFVEDLLRNAAMKATGALKLPYGDYLLDFESPFERVSMKKSVVYYGNIKETDLTEDKIDTVIAQHKIKVANKNASVGEKILALFEELVEPKLIQPTFIIDFPIEVSPLAKRDANNPKIAARYELFIAGMEVANSFTELNDPFDQAERFHEQVKAHAAGDPEAHQYDADFIQALEYGLPPTVGVGIGIDRLVMLLTSTTSIKEVILFPTLKKK